MLTRCGCWTSLTARTSRLKRRSELASPARSEESTLMATLLPVAGCRARWAPPIPPAPIRSWTRYSPICIPGPRAVGTCSAAPTVGRSNDSNEDVIASSLEAWIRRSGDLGEVEVEFDGARAVAVLFAHGGETEQPLRLPHIVEDGLAEG